MGKSGKPGRAKQVHKVKVLHPSSRKASKLTGKCMRKQRIEKKHTFTAIKHTLLIDKLQWFKDNRDESLESYTKADMAELVQIYLQRFDDELEQIEIIHGMKSRKNRQHAAREDVIRMTMQREAEAFKTSGIDMPDLSNPKNLELFLGWEGTSKHAELIRTRKIKLSDAQEPSSKDAIQNVSEKGDGDDVGDDIDEDSLLEGEGEGEENGEEEEEKNEDAEKSEKQDRTNSDDVDMEEG